MHGLSTCFRFLKVLLLYRQCPVCPGPSWTLSPVSFIVLVAGEKEHLRGAELAPRYVCFPKVVAKVRKCCILTLKVHTAIDPLIGTIWKGRYVTHLAQLARTRCITTQDSHEEHHSVPVEAQ